MATTTFYAASSNTSTAAFIAWGKGLSDALTAVGFLKTADMGQIDWSTVAAPTSAAQVAGYEIRVSPDSSPFKFYIKIEYGSSSTSATCAGLWIRVGTGTDGAGNLTGNTSARLGIAGINNASIYPCFVSGGSDRLSFLMFAGLGTYSFCYSVACLKDSFGNSTDEGVDIVAWYYNSSAYTAQQTLFKTGIVNPTTPAKPISALPSNNTGSFKLNVAVCPVLPCQGFSGNPSLNGVVFYANDLPTAGAILTLSIYGVSHKFISGGNSLNNTSLNGSTSACSMAVLYE